MLIQIGDYYADTRSGLFFHMSKLDEYKHIPKEQIDKFAMIRHVKKARMAQEGGFLKTIKIWAFGLTTCSGTCDYCYRHIEGTSENNIKEEQFLDPEYLDRVLKEIEEYRNDDTMYSFFGSSIFTHPHKDKLVDVLLQNKKKYIVLSFVHDMMLPEEEFKSSLDFIKEVARNPSVRFVMPYITVDFGSTSRNSKFLQLTNKDIKDRAKQAIDYLKDESNVSIVIKSNFGKLTNTKEFLSDLYEFLKLPCSMMFSPVCHDQYEPTMDMMSWMEALFDSTPSHSLFRGEILLETSDKSIEFYKRFRPHADPMVRIADGVYLDNCTLTCQAYATMLSIRNNTTSACCYDYLSEHINAVDSVRINKENMRDLEKLTKVPEECEQCDYLGICGQCVPRRSVYKCKDHPSLAEWEVYTWCRRCEEFYEEISRNETTI